MMDLEEVIKVLESRPNMLIQEKNIFLLKAFIDGFLLGKARNNILSESEDNFLSNFHGWVRSRYKSEYSRGWAQEIADRVDSKKEDALHEFIILYKDFSDN